MADLTGIMEQRLVEIRQEISALDFEASEIETAMRVFARLVEPQPKAAQAETAQASVSAEPRAAGFAGPDPLRSVAAAREDAGSAALGENTEKAAVAPPAGEAPASPAPRAPRSERLKAIIAVNAEHPEWTVGDLAKHFRVGDGYMSKALKSLGIKVQRRDGRGGIAGPKGTESLASRIRKAAAEDPSRTMYDIADMLGEPPDRIRNNANANGIKLRKLTASELSEVLRTRPTRGPGKGAEDGRALAEAPKSQPVAERPSAPRAEPTLKVPSSVVVTKPIVRPKGTRFYLRDESGLYLHQSLTRGRDGKPLMTDRTVYAWCDVEARLLAVRRVLPETATLREQVAEKEVRVAA